eukprot:g1912.t1
MLVPERLLARGGGCYTRYVAAALLPVANPYPAHRLLGRQQSLLKTVCAPVMMHFTSHLCAYSFCYETKTPAKREVSILQSSLPKPRTLPHMQKVVTHLDTPQILQGLYRVRKIGQCTAHMQGALFLSLTKPICVSMGLIRHLQAQKRYKQPQKRDKQPRQGRGYPPSPHQEESQTASLLRLFVSRLPFTFVAHRDHLVSITTLPRQGLCN